MAFSPFTTMTDPIRRWGPRRVRAAKDRHIAELRGSLDRLGYAWWPAPLRVCAAMRQISGTSLGALLHLEALVLGSFTMVGTGVWEAIGAAHHVSAGV